MEWANYDLPLVKGWKFHLGEIERWKQIPITLSHETSKAGGEIKELDLFGERTKWKPVDLPHDWLVEQPYDKAAYPAGGFKKRGTGWYHLSFELPKIPIGNARLVFDGVLGNCVVYVNGVAAVRNFSGYNRFSCEVGDYLLPGRENSLALYVDARRWEGWWYEGAGLYRPVRIEFRGALCFEREKAFLCGKKKNDCWSVVTQLQVVGLNGGEGASISVCLMDEEGRTVGEKILAAREATDIQIPIPNAKLWSPEDPYLYTVLYRLTANGEVIDSFEKQIGLRTVEWKKDEGMYLNGRPYKVKGICCHQDHAGVGAAVTKEIMEYRLSVLKELGVNAYRCAHHAPPEELLTLCDKIGILVMVENRHFAVSEDVLRQLDSLVYLSRNHPSVFMYSLFNEEPWQKEERGRRIAAKMRQRILTLDNTRAIIGAQNGGTLEKSNASDSLDIIGINYFLADYEKTHWRTPDKVILGTENCPTYATRGVYKTVQEKQIFANYGDEWGDFSESLEETMETVLAKPYVAGCFAWCGFDYRGEPTPYGWPSVISHWGFCDNCGFLKDTAWLLAAWYQEKLTVHLLPHWNWKKGETVRVCAYTNGDTAELFLNGRSLGEKTVNRRRAEWKIPFEKGAICVRVRRGNEEAFAEVKTAGRSTRILLENVTTVGPDKSAYIINVQAADSAGVTVPDYSGSISFALTGGRILGVGNGDPNNHSGEKADRIKLFHGRAQIIITADTESLRVSGKSMQDAIIRFREMNE